MNRNHDKNKTHTVHKETGNSRGKYFFADLGAEHSEAQYQEMELGIKGNDWRKIRNTSWLECLGRTVFETKLNKRKVDYSVPDLIADQFQRHAGAREGWKRGWGGGGLRAYGERMSLWGGSGYWRGG